MFRCGQWVSIMSVFSEQTVAEDADGFTDEDCGFLSAKVDLFVVDKHGTIMFTLLFLIFRHRFTIIK